jgi:hypothetical protein
MERPVANNISFSLFLKACRVTLTPCGVLGSETDVLHAATSLAEGVNEEGDTVI